MAWTCSREKVARQLQHFAVTGKVTHTSDACYTCGGSGHRSRECATSNSAAATCYIAVGLGQLNCYYYYYY